MPRKYSHCIFCHVVALLLADPDHALCVELAVGHHFFALLPTVCTAAGPFICHTFLSWCYHDVTKKVQRLCSKKLAVLWCSWLSTSPQLQSRLPPTAPLRTMAPAHLAPILSSNNPSGLLVSTAAKHKLVLDLYCRITIIG